MSIQKAQSVENLNEGFCLEDQNLSTSISSTQSSNSLTEGFENYFLETTQDTLDMSVFRCSMNKLFYYKNNSIESVNSDQTSLFQASHITTSEESSIDFSNFCQYRVIKESAYPSSPESEASVSPIILKDNRSNNQGIKLTCKTICNQLMRPITSKILKLTKRSKKIDSIQSNGNEASDMSEEVTPVIKSVKLPYRPQPERVDDELTKLDNNNFNQCGDIVYYYV